MLRRPEFEANIGVLFEFLSMLLHLGLELRGAIDKGCWGYLAAFPLKTGYGDGVDMFVLGLFSFVVIWGGGCARCVASVFRVLYPAVATWTRAEEYGNGKIYCDLDDGRRLITSLIGQKHRKARLIVGRGSLEDKRQLHVIAMGGVNIKEHLSLKSEILD